MTADTTASSLYVVRNEIDSSYEYHCDAVAAQLPAATEVDFVGGERVPLEAADGVVLTGSTAGVYESHRTWIAEQEAFVRELVAKEIPTLGVCFGHQVANAALGGTVEDVGETAGFVDATLADDPLFDGVGPVVVSLHGDEVTEAGDGMETIASADHCPIFGSRHESAPLWTVQFHPEITVEHLPTLERDFDWSTRGYSFDDVTADRIFENFETLVSEYTR